MAALFGSPSFLSHPFKGTRQFSPLSSSSSQAPPLQPLRTISEQLHTLDSIKVLQQKNIKIASKAATIVESTDSITSSLTRRSGLAAFLSVVLFSKHIKIHQEANTRDVEKEEEVVLPNGIRYYEMRIGDGASPKPGKLVVINLKGRVESSNEVFVDTFGEEKKSLALLMESRPYSRGMCEGIECALRSMKAGGKRRVRIPSILGFGEKGADLGSDVQIPPFATLEYIVEVDQVSTLMARV